MALLDTFNGSVITAFIGIAMIQFGKYSIKQAAAFYQDLIQKDPIRTTSLDLLLAFLQRPSANPVVWSIFVWLGGWFFTLLGGLSAIAKLGTS